MRMFFQWLPFFGLLVFTATLVQRTVHVPVAVITPINDKAMPVLALPELGEDTVLTSQSLAGTPMLVNFFASWCGPCAEENSTLVALAGEKKIAIIGIALKDKPEALQAYLQERGNPYTAIGMDNAGKAAIEWGVSGVPETFAVNSAGIVKGHHSAGVTTADAEALVEIALAPVPVE